MQNNGYQRSYPYIYNSYYSRPKTCPIDYRESEYCNKRYLNSLCNTSSLLRDHISSTIDATAIANSTISSASSNTYPVYDSRCTSWYGQFMSLPPDKVKFISATGPAAPHIFTSGASIYNTSYTVSNTSYTVSNTSTLLAVFKIDFDVSALVKNLFKNGLNQGYSFIIETTNNNSIPVLVAHPNMSSTCFTLQCAEAFSDEQVNIAQYLLIFIDPFLIICNYTVVSNIR
jgi:hypothetical protein